MAFRFIQEPYPIASIKEPINDPNVELPVAESMDEAKLLGVFVIHYSCWSIELNEDLEAKNRLDDCAPENMTQNEIDERLREGARDMCREYNWPNLYTTGGRFNGREIRSRVRYHMVRSVEAAYRITLMEREHVIENLTKRRGNKVGTWLRNVRQWMFGRKQQEALEL
jgi:hypothetical protein